MGMDSLMEQYGDKYKKKMYVLKFVRIQREVKKFLRSKKKKIENKNDFYGLLKNMFNKKTFKLIKTYFEYRQSLIFKNINVLLQIKKLMRKKIFKIVKNPRKILKKSMLDSFYLKLVSISKKTKLKKLSDFIIKWKNYVLYQRQIEEVLIRERESNNKVGFQRQSHILKLEDNIFLGSQKIRMCNTKSNFKSFIEGMKNYTNGQKLKLLASLINKKIYIDSILLKKYFNKIMIYPSVKAAKIELRSKLLKSITKNIEYKEKTTKKDSFNKFRQFSHSININKQLREKILKSIHKYLSTNEFGILKKYFYKLNFIPLSKKLFNVNEFENRVKAITFKKHGKQFIDNIIELKGNDNRKRTTREVISLLKTKFLKRLLKSNIKNYEKNMFSKWFKVWFNNSLMVFYEQDEDDFMGDSFVLTTNFADMINTNRKYFRKPLNFNSSNMVNDSFNGEGKGNPGFKSYRQVSFKFKIPLKKLGICLEELFNILNPIIKSKALDMFNNMRCFISENFLKKRLFTKIIPFVNSKENSKMKYYLDIWRKRVREKEMRDLKLISLRFLYSKIKNKFNTSILIERFKFWLNNKKKIIKTKKVKNNVGLLEIINDENKNKSQDESLKSNSSDNTTHSNPTFKSKKTNTNQIISEEAKESSGDDSDTPPRYIKSTYIKRVLEKNLNDFFKAFSKPNFKRFLSRLKIIEKVKNCFNNFVRRRVQKNENQNKKDFLLRWMKKVYKQEKVLLTLKKLFVNERNKTNLVLNRYFRNWEEESAISKQIKKYNKQTACKLIDKLTNFKKRKNEEITLRKCFLYLNQNRITKHELIKTEGFNIISNMILRKGIKEVHEKLSKMVKLKGKFKNILNIKYKLDTKAFFKKWKGNKLLNKLKCLFLKTLITSKHNTIMKNALNKFKNTQTNPQLYYSIHCSIIKLCKFGCKKFFETLKKIIQQKKETMTFLTTYKNTIIRQYFKIIKYQQMISSNHRLITNYKALEKIKRLGLKMFFSLFTETKNKQKRKNLLKRLLINTQNKYLKLYMQRMNVKVPLTKLINYVKFVQILTRICKKTFFFVTKKSFISSEKKKTFLLKVLLSRRTNLITNVFVTLKAIYNSSIENKKTDFMIKNYTFLNKLEKYCMRLFFFKVKQNKLKINKLKLIFSKLVNSNYFNSLSHSFKKWENLKFYNVIKYFKALQIKNLMKIKQLKILLTAFNVFKNNKIDPFNLIQNLQKGSNQILSFYRNKAYRLFERNMINIFTSTLPKPKMKDLYSKFLIFNKIIVNPFFIILLKKRKRLVTLKLIKKRILLLDSLKIYNLPKFIQHWKSAVYSFQKYAYGKELKAKLVKNLYRSLQKNKSTLNYFKSWKNNIFPSLCSKLHIVAQKISKFTLINSNRRNLYNAFKKWVCRIFKFKTKNGFFVKYRLLRKLISHKKDKIDELRRYILMIRLLKWKLIHNSMVDMKVHNIRFASVLLRQFIRRKHIKLVKLKLSSKLDYSRKNSILRQILQKKQKRYFNLNRFFNKWKYHFTINYEIDASVLKCKSLEINFDRPTSNILEKLKGKYLRGNDNQQQRNSNKQDVIQFKINFENAKKYLYKFLFKMRNKCANKLMGYFYKWKKITHEKKIILKTMIIQKFFRVKLDDLREKKKKRYRKNDVMGLELKPRLSSFDMLKNIIGRIPKFMKRRYYKKWKKHYDVNNEAKKLLNNQAYLRNLRYLKLIVKIKYFILSICSRKFRHINAYFKRWMRKVRKARNERNSKIIQKFIMTKFNKAREKFRYGRIRFFLYKFIQNNSKLLMQYYLNIWGYISKNLTFQSKNVNKIINFIRMIKTNKLLKEIKHNFKVKNLLMSIASNYIRNREGLVLKNYFLKLKKNTIMKEINKNAKLIQNFITRRIVKRIIKKKELYVNLENRKDFLRILFFNFQIKYTKYFLRKNILKWQTIVDNQILSQILINRLFCHLFNKYLNFSLIKSLTFKFTIKKLHLALKTQYLPNIFKYILNYSNHLQKEQLHNKAIKTTNILITIAKILNKKLTNKTEALFKKWKNNCVNSNLDYHAKILQNYFKSISNSVKEKVHKEANKRIIRKKVSNLSPEVSIIIKNLFYEKENKKESSKVNTYFSLWSKNSISSRVLKSKFLHSKKPQILLKSILNRYDNTMLSLMSVYKAFWWKTINNSIFNSASMKIQRFCKKQIGLKRRKVSQRIIYEMSFTNRLMIMNKLYVYSKYFKLNMVVEKIGKSALISCLKANFSNSVIEDMNYILKKIIKKMRKKFINDLCMISKLKTMIESTERLMKRRLFTYLNYYVNSSILRKNILLISKEIFIEKLLSYSKLTKMCTIIPRVYVNKHLETTIYCLLSHKFKIYQTMKSLYNTSITKQMYNFNIFSKLVYLSDKCNKSFKKKYFYKLFSPVTTFLNTFFLNRFKQYMNKCMKILINLLKYCERKQRNEREIITKNQTVFFKTLIMCTSLSRINQFFSKSANKILVSNISKCCLLSNFHKTLTKPYLRRYYNYSIVREASLIKLSYYFETLYKKIRVESTEGLKNSINSYIKQFLYFRNLIVGKHKDISVSPIFVKIMSLKLRKRNMNSILNFFKYYNIHRLFSKIMKTVTLRRINNYKHIPKVNAFIKLLFDIMIKQEKKELLEFVKLHNFLKKLQEIYLKNIMKHIINSYKRNKITNEGFRLLFDKIKTITIKQIIEKYTEEKEKNTKELMKISFLKNKLRKLILRNLTINLKEMKLNTYIKKDLKNLFDKIKFIIFKLVTRNIKEMNELNKKKILISKFENIIKSIYLARMLKEYKISIKLGFKIRNFISKIKGIIMKDIFKNILESKENYEKMNFLLIKFNNKMRIFTLKGIIKRKKSHEESKKNVIRNVFNLVKLIKKNIINTTFRTLVQTCQKQIILTNSIGLFKKILRKIGFINIIEKLSQNTKYVENITSDISLMISKLKTKSLKDVFQILKENNNKKSLKYDKFFFILKKSLKKNVMRYMNENIILNEDMREKIVFFYRKIKKVICNEIFHTLYQSKDLKKQIQMKLSSILKVNSLGFLRNNFNKPSILALNSVNSNMIQTSGNDDNSIDTLIAYYFSIWKGYQYNIIKIIKRKGILEMINYKRIFNEWRKNTVFLQSFYSATKIQRYLMKRLLRMKNQVFERKQFQMELKIRGFLRLSSIMRKLPYREAWRKILSEYKRRILISFLLLLKSKKRSYLKRFMVNFKKTFRIKDKKYNKAVEKVIMIFRNRKFRKNFMKLLLKIRVIRGFLINKNEKDRSRLIKGLNNWRRNVTTLNFINSLKFVQFFLRNKLSIIKLKKENEIIVVRQFFKDYIALKMIKPFFKQFFSKYTLVKAYKSLNKYIFKRFTLKTKQYDKTVISDGTMIKMNRKNEPNIVKMRFSSFSKKSRRSNIKDMLK